MPNLIIISGLPCTGKSTLAEGVSRELKIPLFSVDPIESAIIRSGIPRSFETGLAAYVVAETLADEQLKLGQSVIIDAVCSVDEAKQMWRELADKRSVKMIVIECICSDIAIHKSRVDARVRNMPGIPEVTWERVEEVRGEFTEWMEERLVIEASETVEANLLRASNYIRMQLTPPTNCYTVLRPLS